MDELGKLDELKAELNKLDQLKKEFIFPSDHPAYQTYP